MKNRILGLMGIGACLLCEAAGAGAQALPRDASAVLLHHSTGDMVYTKGEVAAYVASWNATYGSSYQVTKEFFPVDRKNYPYDYWQIWVDSPDGAGQKALDQLTATYDVIIWKHCYPAAAIEEDTGAPDITSSIRRIENYKLQYDALKSAMHDYPENRFLVWTLAALKASDTSEDEAARARAFKEWVVDEWDEPGDNIFIWDFFELETEGGNVLLYPGSGSHPHEDLCEKVGPLLAQRLIDVIEGCGDGEQPDDRDGDGVADSVDNCLDVENSDQQDSDGDGAGDVCDVCPQDAADDADGDGVCGDVDNCPLTPNADQADADGDGVGDVCDVCPQDAADDADGDGVCGDVDNCPLIPNADQADADMDGIGDACDDWVDRDDDGVADAQDNCPDVANTDQADVDADGIGDACDTYYECAARALLGEDDPRLKTLRLFRDRVLGGSATGRQLIASYYGTEIESLLVDDPVWRAAGCSLLAAMLPLVEQLVTVLPAQ